MPEVGRFDGIIAIIRYEDVGRHNLPHVHLSYAEFSASYTLDGMLLSGHLPPRQSKIASDWIKIHKDELQEDWDQAVNGVEVKRTGCDNDAEAN